MIPRYTPPAFDELWAERPATVARGGALAAEAMAEGGLVPVGTAAKLRSLSIQSTHRRIEQTTRHDVSRSSPTWRSLPARARWLHRGMTSSDVLDTSSDVAGARRGLLDRAVDRLIGVKRAREHKNTPMIGRSHGIHAEPTTFGVVLAGHLAEVKRGRARLVAPSGRSQSARSRAR